MAHPSLRVLCSGIRSTAPCVISRAGPWAPRAHGIPKPPHKIPMCYSFYGVLLYEYKSKGPRLCNTGIYQCVYADTIGWDGAACPTQGKSQYCGMPLINAPLHSACKLFRPGKPAPTHVHVGVCHAHAGIQAQIRKPRGLCDKRIVRCLPFRSRVSNVCTRACALPPTTHVYILQWVPGGSSHRPTHRARHIPILLPSPPPFSSFCARLVTVSLHVPLSDHLAR